MPFTVWNRVRSVAAWMFFRGYSATWRCDEAGPEELRERLEAGAPFIVAFWHGHELALIPFAKPYRGCALTSLSEDGEMMDYVLRRFGVSTAKGSSSRGAVGGLRGLIRLMGTGRNPLMAVDGPRGPLHRPKSGVFELSRLAEAPIFPAAAVATRSLTFRRSWNKAFLPLPGSRVFLQFGRPLPPVAPDGDPRAGSLAEELAVAICDAEEAARRALNGGRRRTGQ